MTQPPIQIDIAREFERRKPWVTKFQIQDREYGGSFDAMNDGRISQFFQYFPNVSTILELGALEGGHSFALANRPVVKRVTAAEGRPLNMQKALFVQGLHRGREGGVCTSQFGKLRAPSFRDFRRRVLLRLAVPPPEPWKLIQQCARVSPNLFLWTHYAGENEANARVHGLRGKWHEEGGQATR